MHPFTHEDAPPVRVEVTNHEKTERYAPEKSSVVSFPFVGTETAGTRILSRNRKRARAYVAVYSGLLNNNTNGFVYFGTREQVQNKQGAQVPSGGNFEWSGASELWIAADGTNSLTVVVVDEWYLD